MTPDQVAVEVSITSIYADWLLYTTYSRKKEN